MQPAACVEDKKSVMKACLRSSTVFPLMFVNSAGESSGYYYRFLPELSEDLLKCPINVKEPADLTGGIEEKLKTLKFLKELPVRRKTVVADGEEDQITNLWLNLWCKTFTSHDIKEHDYRLAQLLEVLSQWQTKDADLKLDMHSSIIRTCCEYGSAKLTVVFFENIKAVEVRSHASVLNHYLNAISSGETAKSLFMRLSRSSTFEETKSIIKDSVVDYPAGFKFGKQPFQQRTFLTEKMGNVISEEVKLGISIEDCAECRKPDEQIILDSEKVPHRFCSQCRKELTAKLKVRVGRPTIYSLSTSVFWEHEVKILPIRELKEAVERLCEGRKLLELWTLRNKEMVFWNAVWYFTVHKLPYDLFLPYQTITRKSIVVENLGTKSKNKHNADEDGMWFDQFKQVRGFALCADSETQTDPQ
eukprot:TRINITY_DN17430_c0_g1_i1.p1 TRINITY_DN17430_c0_g1~~TRINITY_DN17430_c0_g1_i1.p1  ORF type:complete len:417 (+),score=88.13 TRINITY_DN17430_c0_g1_i1:265-1515(+)